MKKRSILKSEFEKFDELDHTHPYKVTCPEMFPKAERYSSLQLAMMAMDDARTNSYQAILTYSNIAKNKIEFKGYSAPNWIFRKAG